MKIAITSFEESERAIRAVRDTVFGQEQKVDRALDWDGKDPGCAQVVAIDDSGKKGLEHRPRQAFTWAGSLTVIAATATRRGAMHAGLGSRWFECGSGTHEATQFGSGSR